MKLRKWLSFFLIVALVISILQRPGIKVSAEENTEDIVSEETNQKITVSENDDSGLTTEKSDEENETDENEEDKQLDDKQEETVIPEEKVPQENKTEEEPTGQPEGALKTDQPMTLNALESEANSEKEEIPDEVEEDLDLPLTEEPEPKPQTADIASGTDRDITWVIDADGKLTVSGTGDFSTTIKPWDQYKEQIISAEVNVLGMTDTSSMFSGCKNMISVDLDNFDTSNVIEMRGMFFGCSSLKSLDLSSFNTSNVTDMRGMFSYCSSLESLDLSSFNTGNVIDMGGMFSYCSGLESLDLSSFNTGNVTDMGDMFYACVNLKSLDVSNFNTRNVTIMGDVYGMFSGCSSLISLDVSNFNTEKVITMESMFRGCDNLVRLDVSNFDTSNVINMSRMFEGCSGLIDLNIDNFNTCNVTDMSRMFNDCSNLKRLDLNNFDTHNVTEMWMMFSGCSNLIDCNISSFNTVNVKEMYRMFSECHSLKKLDISGFNTSNVISMEGMFYGCSSLTSLNVSSFNTVNVDNVGEMFSGCSALEKLDVSNFDISNVIFMYGMFRDCINLTDIDISGFHTNNVINMLGMFRNCKNLTYLDLSNFDVSNIDVDGENTGISDIFFGCTSLMMIKTPCNLAEVVALPVESGEYWYLPDGIKTAALPQNLNYSIIVRRHRNPRIITTTQDLNMDDVIRVKYIPYSYTIKTDNLEEDNMVTYSIEEGKLAKGLQIYANTGEIYGVPLEAGEFPIRVKAEFSNPEYLPSYSDLTLTVLDNSDNHVFDASDPGYEVEQYIGTQVFASPGSSDYYYVLKENVDQLFVSAGKYEEFIDLWLNGEKLTAGEDYTKESGSTRITIRSQTLANKTDKNGTNTIAAEFRVGGNPDNDLKRTAQNFRIDFQQEDTRSEGNSQSGGRHSGSSRSGGDGASGEESIIANSAIAVVRLIDAAGNPLANTTLELHSTPQIAQTNQNGIAVFGGVPEGVHTLYVKDRNGNILASRSFELLFGDIISLNGEQVIVKAGAAFTFQVQMSGNELKFLNVYGGDIYQVLPANTDDQENIRLWLMLMLISGSVICGTIFYRRRKYRYYEG